VLASQPQLQAAASAKCQDMSARDYFSHVGPEGESPCSFVKAQGLTDYIGIAENIAGGPGTAEGILGLWKNSRGHNRNMLNSRYNNVGYGVCADQDGGSLAVQIFLRI